eukprot:gene13366-16967_t
MMLTYFAGKGGAGMVIDGVIRDAAKAFALDIGYWMRGASPNFHTQTTLMPHAVNVPIACGGTYVRPGDIIIADDDGAICVPIAYAERLLEAGSHHAEWEDFSRLMLSKGGDLRRYYPLAPEAEAEYLAWKAQQKPRPSRRSSDETLKAVDRSSASAPAASAPQRGGIRFPIAARVQHQMVGVELVLASRHVEPGLFAQPADEGLDVDVLVEAPGIDDEIG